MANKLGAAALGVDPGPLAGRKRVGRESMSLQLFALAGLVLACVFRSHVHIGSVIAPCSAQSTLSSLLQKEADSTMLSQEGWLRPQSNSLPLCRHHSVQKGLVSAAPSSGIVALDADAAVVCAGGGGSSSGTSMACPVCGFAGKKGAASLRAHWRQKHRLTLGEYEEYDAVEDEVAGTSDARMCDSELADRCEEIVDVGLDAYGDMKYTAFEKQATLQRAKDAGRKVSPPPCVFPPPLLSQHR